MESTETYKGNRITITTRAASGGWTARARFALPGQDDAELESAVHPTEDAARSAALRAAVERIDQGRVSRGKP